MKIDVLITKKDRNVVIANPIAAIFRSFNAFEFKSPTDYLGVNDFYKGYVYGHLYKILNNVDLRDVTFSFVVPNYPRSVIQEIREVKGFTVLESPRGIHVITGGGLPMQIIESKRLSDEDNLFLSHLSNDLDTQKLDAVLTKAKKRHKVVMF